MSIARKGSKKKGKILVRNSSNEDICCDDYHAHSVPNFEDLVTEENKEQINLILMGISTPEFIADRKAYVLYPSDKSMVTWEIVISIILMATCFLTPLNFAF